MELVCCVGSSVVPYNLKNFFFFCWNILCPSFPGLVICLLPTKWKNFIYKWKWFLRNISLNEGRNCEGEVSYRGHVMIINLFTLAKCSFFPLLCWIQNSICALQQASFVHIVGITLMFRRIWSEQVNKLLVECLWRIYILITCYCYVGL